MPFVLLLLLGLICLQERWPESLFGLQPWQSATFTFAGLVCFWLAASMRTAWYCRQVVRDPLARRALVHRFHLRQRSYFLALAAYYLLALYVLGWGWTVKTFCSEVVPFASGIKLALVLPFLVSLMCAWSRFYDLEKLSHDLDGLDFDEPFLGRGAYVVLQVRFNLLLVVLFLFLMLLHDAVAGLFPELDDNESFMPLFTIAFLAVAFPSIPWLLRIFLGLRSLPQGPLRDSLEAVARRTGFRCNDLLIWNTRNSMANAMVTGILPCARYIVLTDRLIRELSTEEIQAVLGHEIGHIKHHHMSFYMMFLLGSLLALACAWQICEDTLAHFLPKDFVTNYLPALEHWLPGWEFFAAIPPMILGGLYVYLVFGYLSRYCERQADIFGSRTVSCQVFINALEKVAALNGINRDNPGRLASWLHPPIARRVDLLQRMQEDPQLEPLFQRRLGLVKWSMSLGLCVVLAVTLWLGTVVKSTVAQDATIVAGEKLVLPR